MRVPPHNLEAERFVLGAMLIDPEAANRAAEFMRPEDFYHSAYALVFQEAIALLGEGKLVEVMAVVDRLAQAGKLDQVGGPAAVSMFPDQVASTANLDYYMGIVRDRARLRAAINHATMTIQEAYDGPESTEAWLDSVLQRFFALAVLRDGQGPVGIRQVVDGALDRLERVDLEPGLLTGFPSLDRLLQGLHPGHLIILAGRPSMGKTSLALALALNVARAGTEVIFFSLEMTSVDLGQRMLAQAARVDSRQLREIRVGNRDWPKIIEAAEKLRRLPLFLDDQSSPTLLTLRARARRQKAERGAGLVIVDYLQLIATADRRNREEAVSDISRGLKALAKDLKVPVLALAQLNRQVEMREVKKPRLSDLRESGSIEQDADVVLFINRPGLYERGGSRFEAELIVAKQRCGPTGDVPLYFNEAQCFFGEEADECRF